MDIDNLIMRIKEDNIVQLISNSGQALTMFYSGEFDSHPFTESFIFTMAIGSAQDEEGQNLDLEMRLPTLTLHEESGIYTANFDELYDEIWPKEYEIEKGKIIEPSEFSPIKLHTIQPEDVGRLVRLELSGKDSQVVGYITAVSPDEAVCISPLEDIDSPIIIEQSFLPEFDYILKDPLLEVFFKGKDWDYVPLIRGFEATPVYEILIENRYIDSMF